MRGRVAHGSVAAVPFVVHPAAWTGRVVVVASGGAAATTASTAAPGQAHTTCCTTAATCSAAAGGSADGGSGTGAATNAVQSTPTRDTVPRRTATSCNAVPTSVMLSGGRHSVPNSGFPSALQVCGVSGALPAATRRGDTMRQQCGCVTSQGALALALDDDGSVNLRARRATNHPPRPAVGRETHAMVDGGTYPHVVLRQSAGTLPTVPAGARASQARPASGHTAGVGRPTDVHVVATHGRRAPGAMRPASMRRPPPAPAAPTMTPG